MVPDYVIVTVQTESGTFLGDFQLPTAVPVGKIAALLREGLRKQLYGQIGSWEKMELCWRGFPLVKEKTLADHGIWDGNIITVREGTK